MIRSVSSVETFLSFRANDSNDIAGFCLVGDGVRRSVARVKRNARGYARDRGVGRRRKERGILDRTE